MSSVIIDGVRADEFVTRRRPEWDRLEKLLQRAGNSRVGGLRPTEVLSLAALYRRATADFARAQRDWPTEPVAAYLNGLVARGHAAVYRQGGNLGQRIAIFYRQTLPQTYRQAAPFLIAAALLLFGPALIAFIAVSLDPRLAYALVPAELVQLVHSHQLWTQIPENKRALASGVIMANNIRVADGRQGGRVRDYRFAPLRIPAPYRPIGSEAFLKTGEDGTFRD